MPLATWLASATTNENATNEDIVNYWPNTVFITGLAVSMAVNTLATGMIVFRILKATGVRPISFERNLGSSRDNKFRHIIFIIIESGMALFAIQLVRVVLGFISVPESSLIRPGSSLTRVGVLDIVIVINQILNVIIIRSVHFYFFYFADNICLDRASHQR